VQKVMAFKHRIARLGLEWMCRACNYALSDRSRRPIKFCGSCQGGVFCGEMIEAAEKVGPVCSGPTRQSMDIENKCVPNVLYSDVVKGSHKSPVLGKHQLPAVNSDFFWTTVLGHFAELETFHELEQYVLDHQDVWVKLPALPEAEGNRQQQFDKLDDVAMRDMPTDQPLRSPFPIKTNGNGNCFCNGLSRLIYGDEEHADELRVRLTIDAVVNKRHYVDNVTLQSGVNHCVPSDSFVDHYLFYSLPMGTSNLPHGGGVEADQQRQTLFEHLTFNFRKNLVWANIWQFHQAANILKRNVRCIYPQWRETERRLYNRIFVPLGVESGHHSAPALNIMFCRTSQSLRRLNHFVPVVEQQFAVNIAAAPLPKTSSLPVIIDIENEYLSPKKRAPQPDLSQFQQRKKRKQDTPHHNEWQERMDVLDDIHINDPVVLVTPPKVDLPLLSATPSSSRRKQKTPRRMLNKWTPSSNRKQKTPGKILSDKVVKFKAKPTSRNGNRSSVRKKMFSENSDENENDDLCVPLKEELEHQVKMNNSEESYSKSGQCTLCHKNGTSLKLFVPSMSKFTEKQKTTVLLTEHRVFNSDGEERICRICDKFLLKGGVRKNWNYFKQNHKSGKCTLCHIDRKEMTRFVEENYNPSEKIKDTVLAKRYRIVDSDGDELICGKCHKYLERGSKRRKWKYYQDTNGTARQNFLLSLSEFPQYTCTVCHRMLFSYSVISLEMHNFDTINNIVSECLAPDIRKKSFDDNEYICHQCHNSLRKQPPKMPKMPNQAVANNLRLTTQPDVLKNLTTMERRCIGLHIPFMTIKSVRQNGKNMKGPCVNVPASLEPMCTLLPRLPEEMKTVLIKLKRRLDYNRSYMFDYIRPQVVMEALLWLKAHNVLYKNVTVNNEWFDQVEYVASDHFNIVKDSDGIDSDGYISDEDEDIYGTKKQKRTEKLPEIDVTTGQESSTDAKDASDDDFEEEQEAAEFKSKVTVQASSTCVQLDNLEEAIFAIAPGENSKPKLLLTDDEFELSCFPDYFPTGEGAFHCPERQTDLALRRYVNQRLLNVDGRFGRNLEYIFAMQYAVELKQLEMDKGVYIRNHSFHNGTKFNASMIRDSSFVTELVRHDSAFKFMRNVRGTPAYWKSKMFDTLAMFNGLGKPTWFMTLSAAEQLWPEMIQAVGLVYGERYTIQQCTEMNSAKKARMLRRNPVTTVRIWKHRLESFFNGFVKNEKASPVGKVKDYVVKIEFQARGSPHAHILLWVEDAPHIGEDDDDTVCDFIGQFSCGRIMNEWPDAPADCTLDELNTLVKRVQVHKHNPMCRPSKKAKCRHSFPKVPSFKTIITQPELYEQLNDADRKHNQEILSAVSSEIENDFSQTLAQVVKKAGITDEEYTQILLASDPARKVILERQPQDIFVNNYSPQILSLWKANMDLQYCVNTIQCINYLMSYVVKCEKGMSELMMRIKENYKERSIQEQMSEMVKGFTGKREVSVQEAIYRVLSLPLCLKSKNNVFISGDLSAKRDRVPKKKEVIASMKDDDEDVFEKSIHDRYESRPDKLDNMCLADFGTWYTTYNEEPAKKNDDRYIELKNGLGWMSKRKEQSLLRTHKPRKDTNEFFQHQLLLFFPYRHESELLAGYVSYAEHYSEVFDIIQENSKKYNIFQEELDEAFIERMKRNAEDDANPKDWQLANKIEDDGSKQSELCKRFRNEVKKQGKMSEAEYISKIRTSNVKQKQVVLWCRNHVKKQIRCMKQGQSPEGFKLVLTGPGGTGKSHTINLINHDVIDLFGRTNTIDPNDLFEEGRDPEKPTALLTATTGTAAFNIHGSTLHSVMLMHHKILPKEKACVLQSQLHQLQLVTVDEFSMMGSQLLSLLNKRCCFLKQNVRDDIVQSENRRNFGNINILLVGDPYQLPAVMQTPIYRPPNIKSLEDFQKPLWNDFRLHELTQVMRQKDINFANLLSRLRVAPPAANTEDDLILQSRQLNVTFADESYPKQVLHVFAQNDAASVYNEQMLAHMDDRPLHSCVAEDRVDSAYGKEKPSFSKKPSETGNLLQNLKVKVGARVMLTNNLDVPDGLTNGAFGTITCIVTNKDPNIAAVRTILVQFDSLEVGRAAKANSRWKAHYPHSVPIDRVEANFPFRRGKMMYTATRQQFPLFLAWGVTIHKTQGMTLPAIVVEMDPKKGKYQKGQAYVAFSRVTSLEGLHINNYCIAQIKVETEIHKEMEIMREQCVEPLPQPLLLSSLCDLKVGHLNIHGLFVGNIDKADDMQMDSVFQCLDVLCLSETHLAPTNTLPNNFWDNFQVFRLDRDCRGGGVLIGVKKEMEVTALNLPATSLEIVGVEISIPQKQKTIGVFCCYLPPLLNKSHAAEELKVVISSFTTNMCVVTGDMNEDLLGGGTSQVQKIMGSLGLTQHIRHPTCIHGSLLDHLYSNSNDDVQAEVSEIYFSDHDLVSAGLIFDT